jgi:hypothetical protein
MLKVSVPYISSSVNNICNKSIRSGTFHTHLKYSILTPLFTNGDRENVANYRSISLLISFTKVFEKSYMKDFCNIFKLITFC